MRRRIRLTCVAVGLTSMAVSAAGLGGAVAHAAADPGSGFQSLSLSALAAGEHIVGDKISGQAPGSFDMGVPFAESTFNGSIVRSLTSVAWPGDLLGNFGSLVIVSGGPQQASALNDPVRAVAQNQGQQKDSATTPGITMTATATDTDATSDTTLAGDQNAAIGRYGATRTTTSGHLTGVTSAVTEAASTVQDISLAGGQVTIGSVVSHAKATTDGKKATATGGTVVTGVKVGGVPVQVDDKGVHVGPQSQSLTTVNDTVNTVLTKLQLTMFVSAPTKVVKAGSGTYDAGSLVISFKPGIVIALGGAHAQAAATRGTSFGGLNLPPVPAGGGGAAALPASSGGNVGTPASDLGGGSAPDVAGPSPQVALASHPLQLPGASSPAWAAIGLLGAALLAAGLVRLPAHVLTEPATACPLGDQP